MLAAISEVIATTLDVIFMIWFVPKFFGRHFWDKPWMLFIPGAMLTFQLIADQFMLGYDLLYMVVVVVFTYLYSLVFANKRYFHALFLTCLYFGVQTLTGSALHAVFNLLVDDVALLAINSGTNERVLFLVAGKLVQYAGFKLLAFFFDSQGELTIKYNLLFFMHTVLTMAGLVVLFPLSYYAKDSRFSILLTAMVLVLLNVVVYYMVYQLIKLLKSKYELDLLQEKMAFEKIRAKEVGAIWDDVRKIRHDLKNHLTVMRGQLQQGNTDDCQKYVNELIPVVKSKGNLQSCGNDMLDYLINSKLQGMKDTEILISGTMNNQPNMDDADLVCMLGRVLDDAMAALVKVTANKRIEIHFFTKNAMCIIVCKHTVGEDTGYMKKKEAQRQDGFVDFIAEKYGGMVERLYKDDMFCVQIVLPQDDMKIQ